MMGGQTGNLGEGFANQGMQNPSMMKQPDQSLMANQSQFNFQNPMPSQMFNGNTTGMAPSLDNMSFINQHSFLPTFQKQDFSSNDRGDKKQDQKDQGAMKKFAFMYEEIQGTVFQLSGKFFC